MILLTTLVLNTYIALLSLQINGIMSSDFIRILLFLFLAVEGGMMILLRIKSKFRMKRSRIRLPGVIAAALAFIAYLFCCLPAANLTISRIIEFLFFPFCLIVTYINFINIKDEKTFDKIVDIQFYYLIVVAAAFLLAQVIQKGKYNNNVNTVYYVIFVLPFILQHKNTAKKWIGLGIILLCLFLSLKRAPLIAAVLALVFYSNARQPVLKLLVRVGFIFLAVIAIDALFSHYGDVHMLDRLQNLSADGGSGRVDLAKQTFELLAASNLVETLFGRIVPTASVFPRGAHNDFLEVLFRMGILGFLIFIGYFIGIIAIIITSNKTGDYENSNFLKAVLILFGIVSFSSQLIFLPTYVGLVALSVSFAAARNRLHCSQRALL